jgi:RNA polymerase sigma-70 factor (ECF subfamily)
MTDEELVKKSLEETKYFGILIKKYEQQMLRYVLRMSNVDKSECNDILQEIFLKAWKNLESFNFDFKFSTWLYRIAHNETINYYKKHIKKSCENTLNVSSEHLENISGDIRVDKDVDKNINGEILSKSISKLKQELKDVVILHYFEEKGYGEISDILKIPTGSVSTTLTKARKELYSELYYIKDNHE